MRILLVRLSSIGDIVHTLPALSAVRRNYPKAHIDWLVESRYAEILTIVSGIDTVVEIDTFGIRKFPWSLEKWGGLVSNLQQLRRINYDIILDFQGTLKSAVSARLARGKRRIGYGVAALKESPAALFYSERASLDGGGTHVIEHHLHLLSKLGIYTKKRDFSMTVSEDVYGEVDREIAALGLSEFVLLNPGGNWNTKRWAPEKFGRLAEAIYKELHIPSLVLWGPGDQGLASSVVESSEGAAYLMPPTGISSMIAFATRARLFVTGDTGPMHLASAFNVSIVGIFGPTDPNRNGPFGLKDEIVSKEVPCGPCYKNRCPGYGNVCMTSINVEDVMVAVRQKLA